MDFLSTLGTGLTAVLVIMAAFGLILFAVLGIMAVGGLFMGYLYFLAHLRRTAQYKWLFIVLTPVVIATLWGIGKLIEG